METNETHSTSFDQPAPNPTPGLELNNEGMVALLEARKWANLLAILGFVGLGLMVIIGLFLGVILSALGATTGLPFPAAILALFYLGMAVMYFFPILYLYRFARRAQTAVLYRSPHELTATINNLKSHYQFLGILILVGFGLYVGFILFTYVTTL